MSEPGIATVSNEADIPDELPPAIQVELAESSASRALANHLSAIAVNLKRIADALDRISPPNARDKRTSRR